MIAHRVRNLGLAVAARIPAPSTISTGGEILLIRPDHIGDLLFLTPALHRLRLSLPLAKITLVTGPWGTDVVSGNPDIDEHITIPFPGFSRERTSSPIVPYRMLATWEQRLRDRAPGAAVILRDDHWWGAWLTQRAGIPIRIGVDHPVARGFLTRTVPVPGRHWVRRNAALLDATASLLGGQPPDAPVQPETAPLCWTVTASEDEEAATLLREAGGSGPFVVIHPGSGAPVKHWPTKRWAAVAMAISDELGWDVVLTGSAAEQPLVEQIQATLPKPVVSLAGRTSLRQLGALFRRARLVCGVDSGPLHLAVATGTPTIHLYGPSSIEDYGPWGDPHRHQVITADMHCPRCGDLSPNRPEGAGCMVAITVEHVTTAVREVLSHG